MALVRPAGWGTSTQTGVAVELRAGGRLAREVAERAREAIGAVVAEHAASAGLARLRLAGTPCVGGPLLVQVNLRVCGAPARIQVAGPTVDAAIDAGRERLDRQIRRLSGAWEAWPWPDPRRRPLGIPGRGEIVRTKLVRLRLGMPCQATAVMNAMDYDVHLYTDAETGEDAVVYRAGPTGVRLARQRSMHPSSMPATLPLTVNPRTIATLSPAEAADRLEAGWLPFLFFTNVSTGRGNLLYRRYDGQLGLVGPASGRADA
jgi:hypothetical protein